MARIKTTATTASVSDFINAFANTDEKKADSFLLAKLLQNWSGCEPYMWGPTIIGFGSYHYKYASGHEGDAPMLGFSPRKAALTLYVYSARENNKHLLDDLGKYKISKACLYIKKLSDISIAALEAICKDSIEYLNEHHECSCRIK